MYINFNTCTIISIINYTKTIHKKYFIFNFNRCVIETKFSDIKSLSYGFQLLP